MQKVKHDLSAKPKNIVWRCLRDTELLYFFDRNSCPIMALGFTQSFVINRETP